MIRLLEPAEVVQKIQEYPHRFISVDIWQYDRNRAYAVVVTTNDHKMLGSNVIKAIEFDLEEDDPREYVKQLQNLKARIKRRYKSSHVTSNLRW